MPPLLSIHRERHVITFQPPDELGERIAAAIHALIDERAGVHTVMTVDEDDGYSWPRLVRVQRPSVYDEMRSDLAGRQGTSTGGVARSLPPVWVDGLDWVAEVDRRVAWWTEQFGLDGEHGRVDVVAYGIMFDTAGTTTARLRNFAAYEWPNDQVWLGYGGLIAREIEGWKLTADQLVEGVKQRKLEVIAPCPQCGERYVHRKDSAGEIVRQAALQMTLDGCKCLSCNDLWAQDNLLTLSRVIDYESVPEQVPAESEPADVRGEANGRAELTWDEVRAIRADHTKGTSMRALAAAYDISKSQIHRIVTGASWHEPDNDGAST